MSARHLPSSLSNSRLRPRRSTPLFAGISLALASLQVFVRDVEHVLMPVLMMLMYLTPILYPLTLVEACEQVRAHLVVLGNAAHSLHPIAGQGYNLSLRDALCLAETLLAGPPRPGDLPSLQSYLERQRLDQELTVGFSDRVTRLFSNARPLLAAGRNLGLLGLDLLPPAKRWFARQAMGLGTRPH